MTEAGSCLDQLLDEAVSRSWTRTRRQLRFRLEFMLKDVDLRGKSFLDIGGGTGVVTLYAACQGASTAICLEPETAGSSPNRVDPFPELAARLGVSDSAQLLPYTLQEYDPGGQKFDVVLMMASVHHLDERAASHLPKDPKARQVYLEMFRKIFDMMEPGGTLIIHDVSREHLYPMLGLKNPLVRQINWSIHPRPGVWAALLERSGFSKRKLEWLCFDRAGRLGQALLGNRVGAFLTFGSFMLVMGRD